MQARKGAVRNLQICEVWLAAKPPLRVQQRKRHALPKGDRLNEPIDKRRDRIR